MCFEKPLWVGERDEAGRGQGAGRTMGTGEVAMALPRARPGDVERGA